MKKEYTIDLIIEREMLMYNLVVKFIPSILLSDRKGIKNAWHNIINDTAYINDVDMEDVRRVNAIERLENEIGKEEMIKEKVLIPSEYLEEIEFEGRPYHMIDKQYLKP